MPRALYDSLGASYTTTRQADPRIAAAIRRALGDASRVLNVGAGAGAYEPADLEVTALEPSPVMIAQRPPGSRARVMEGAVEALALVAPALRQPGACERRLREALGPLELVPVPIPHDCTDGFYGAFWRRPHAFLDPAVRAGISVFDLVDPGAVGRAVAALARDLADGTWQRRHADLLELDALDLGYAVVVAEHAA